MSYAHEDEMMKDELNVFLAPLRRTNKIEVWHDRKILPGDPWDTTIIKELEESDIILLLISAYFNNSDYIWNVEIKKAMEKQAKGEVRVIPVILKNCLTEGMPYMSLNALPTGARPVVHFDRIDDAYYDIAVGISSVVDYLIAHNN